MRNGIGWAGIGLLALGVGLPASAGTDPWAWGWNFHGQLGDESTESRSQRVAVQALQNVTALEGGFGHSLALRADGTVLAWGDGSHGAMGDGTDFSRKRPVTPVTLGPAIAIAAGSFHNLAVQADGTVWAWGPNGPGALGNGNATTETNLPVQVSALTGMTAVAAGNYTSYALKSDGTVWAWGDNGSGKLGDGTDTDRNVPVKVHRLAGITSIGAATTHGMAVDGQGRLWTWGYNGRGGLCDGQDSNRSEPVEISSLGSDVVSAAGGDAFTIVLKSDGTVWGCGLNDHGQLGNGTTSDTKEPIRVSNLEGVVAIAAGFAHSLAVKSDGTIWAWGFNDDGQLGDGTTEERIVPVRVANVLGAVGVGAGSIHSLARVGPAVSVNPAALAFGSQVAGFPGAAKTITVSNTGLAPLHVSLVEILGAHADDFVASSYQDCATVALAGSCTIDVGFTPGGLGARSAVLDLSHDALHSPHSVHLTGTGTNARADLGISLADAPDPVKRGANLTHTVTVRNHGPDAVLDARMTMPLPAGNSFVSATSTQGSCALPAIGATGTVSCKLGGLANGVGAQITVVSRVGDRGKATISTTATVTPLGFTEDANAANNTATANTSVSGSKK